MLLLIRPVAACCTAGVSNPKYLRNSFLEKIFHYNNDFEIDKMCLRNSCALKNMHMTPRHCWNYK